MIKFLKRFFIRSSKYLKWIMLLFILIFVASNLWVILSSYKKIYRSSEKLPFNNVTLVLGTSKYVKGGNANPFFYNRMDAAYHLYESGKTKHFILSGDNRTSYYNEPSDMKRALLERGVPESAITLDYAGLRTLDSMVRGKEVFGQEQFTVITQEFHCYRALFICEFYKIDAIAYVADRPPWYRSLKVLTRELLARPLAIIDLYFLNKSPKFKGKKEDLNY